MKPIDQATICVCDHGLFVPLALRLAENFKRVLYYSPCEAAFPGLAPFLTGDFPPVERCNDIWKVKQEVDLWCFPDIGYAGLQKELSAQGYPVWGSRSGDEYEASRTKFLRTLKKLDMEVAPYEVVVGLAALREHLRQNEDKFIKISRYRGLTETFHHDTYEGTQGRLDQLAVKLGPFQDDLPFIVVDRVETEIELGADTYCVNGQWPSLLLEAYEWKDSGYLGAVKRREDVSPHIQEVMENFGPLLAAEDYANFFSMELRVDGKKAYFLDPCCRGPLPGTGAHMEIWENLDEVIYGGARGELVEPVSKNDFVAEAVLKLKGEKESWGELIIPDSMLRYCRFGACCRAPGGAVAFAPDDSSDHEVGWLAASGPTIRSAIKQLLYRASKLPSGLSADTRSMIDLLDEVRSAEEKGIEFTEQTVPTPQSVIVMEPA